jgi:hypothetical protein
VPDVAVENVTQVAGLCADHEQLDPAVIATVPDPAVAATEAVVGEML